MRLKLGLLTAAWYQQALTNGLLANLTPTINTQPDTAYTVNTVSADNDGKTILRMTSASANTVTIPSSLTLPISIRQAGTGLFNHTASR